MRNELELIQKIEDYLANRLSPEEKALFETQLAGDASLQEAVQLQQEVMRGVERAALKAQVKQAGHQFNWWRNFTRWGLGGLSIVLVGAVIGYVAMSGQQQAVYNGKELPALNEKGEKQWADADRNIPAQVFTLYAGKDTVIETRAGMVLSVPANGFLDENNQPLKGPVSLIVKEALDAATAIQAGLSTMSGSQQLETGGMFFVDARQGEKIVRINPVAGIYMEVPADMIKPGMQLYSGNRLPDGRIDWVNPVPLEKDLVPVDILSLDFYPPLYLDSLQAWGYNSRDKVFTDSLYYSMATFLRTYSTFLMNEGDSSFRPYKDEVAESLPCAINPAKIQAIKSSTFQNTLLATREFEERMPWIHRSYNNKILDLYVNNPDKRLSEIDSMASLLAEGEVRKQFIAFAARKDGKVSGRAASLQALQQYYQLKTKACEEAVLKTNEAYWEKQADLDAIAIKRGTDHIDDSVRNAAGGLEQELTLNLKEAARQLGYDSTQVLRWPARDVYRVQVNSAGWYNIDRAVLESTINRTTLDFTDSATGKKAVIRYQSVSFQIEEYQDYERLYVYLLPDGWNSFMRLNGAEGKYTERLNELVKYTAVVIGYKGEQAFFFTQANVQAQDYTGLRLQAVSGDDLSTRLKGMGKGAQAAAVKKELDYFGFEFTDQRRRMKNLELIELGFKVISLLSACDLQSA